MNNESVAELLLTCPKGHKWPPHAGGGCPFCHPEEFKLSSFDKVGFVNKFRNAYTGSYTAKDLREMEDSHNALISLAYYWAGRSMKPGDEEVLEQVQSCIRRAENIRKKVGIE